MSRLFVIRAANLVGLAVALFVLFLWMQYNLFVLAMGGPAPALRRIDIPLLAVGLHIVLLNVAGLVAFGLASRFWVRRAYGKQWVAIGTGVVATVIAAASLFR